MRLNQFVVTTVQALPEALDKIRESLREPVDIAALVDLDMQHLSPISDRGTVPPPVLRSPILSRCASKANGQGQGPLSWDCFYF